MKLVHINDKGVRFYAMVGNLFAVANVSGKKTVSTCLSFTHLNEHMIDQMDASEVHRLQKEFGKN
ncbi:MULTISPECIES: hypothetical protein [Persicobacter]|uniref:Uncharacterized protein n=1 Tax=Persicobacter diffluens TaxID=981 RepID=A0AAN4VXP5_9BACT|nr:hypothetical protein [Persicobacter sp. CCB-QB2]GJM60767.1 hypothetical protein PEDI_13190 [Persicobacter diffluens]